MLRGSPCARDSGRMPQHPPADRVLVARQLPAVTVSIVTATSGWSLKTPSMPASTNTCELADQVAGRVRVAARAELDREELVLEPERPAVHREPGGVGVGDDRRRRAEGAGRGARDHDRLLEADAVGVRRDLGEPGRASRGRRSVRGSPAAVKSYGRPEELTSWARSTLGHPVELAQVADLEALHDHGRVGAVDAVRLQRRDERLLEREADRVEVRRVLRLGVDADLAPVAADRVAGEVDDLVERRAPGRARRRPCSPGRVSGSRSFARSVLSSASVKSSVNHPVTLTPSITLVAFARPRTRRGRRHPSCR